MKNVRSGFCLTGLLILIADAAARSEGAADTSPVGLAAVANRGFRDEVAGDRRGGWTDQGPDNDAAGFPVGRRDFAGVPFEVLDPARNNGRAVLALGRAGREEIPLGAEVPVAGGPVWRRVFLLHTAAWLPAAGRPVGRLRVRYRDGTESTDEVVAGRDVGNWWSPLPLPNARVGWTGENPSSVFGVQVAGFAVEPKPVAALRFEAAGEPLWLIVGVTGSATELEPCDDESPLVVEPGPDWAPYRHTLEVAPGGVFDRSRTVDAPAGRHGPLVVTPQGRFEFAGRPGERARFWGVNLCVTANFLEGDEADRVAERLARSGYNAARIHHYDRWLVRNQGASAEPDPAQLDRLDRLFAALKRHGLHVSIDLYSARDFTAAEIAAMGIAPGEDVRNAFKALMPVDEAAFAAWARFARELLTHRNPHTGLTWAEDPALVGVCPVNEDTISVWIRHSPTARRRYEALFADWWEAAENRASFGDDRDAGFHAFIHERQAAGDVRMRDFLRSLGVVAPLTGANFETTRPLVRLRERHDYVDVHLYWDHPQFPGTHWRPPFEFRQASATRAAARTPRELMPARVWGRPFVVSEFNYVRPNRYRAEGGVIMPAYASLQDWDGVFNFEYAMTRESAVAGGVAATFSLADDPIGLLADRISALVFLRGDIAPARHAISFAVNGPGAYAPAGRTFPDVFSRLGLVARIGSGTESPAEAVALHGLDAVVTGADAAEGGAYVADDALPARLVADGVLPAGLVGEDGGRYSSDTGQIEIRPHAGSMRVVTPRSELFALPAGSTVEGDRVAVRNGDVFCTVSVVSVDDRPITTSERLLVAHLTDALPAGMRFANARRTRLEAKGEGPHLVRAGEAEIRLGLTAGREWRAWALDAAGVRLREVPLARDGDVWILRAATVTPEGAQLAYEIAVR